MYYEGKNGVGDLSGKGERGQCIVRGRGKGK